jgi:hypothetical protein
MRSATQLPGLRVASALSTIDVIAPAEEEGLALTRFC